jgi:DNA polymerase-3 subunit delta
VDFKKFTEENGAQPIYLFEGEEGYFREGGERLIKSRFLQDATLDYATFDGSTLKGNKISSLVAAVNCFPFISQKRVVKVTEFYPTEEEYQTYLKDLFENPPDYSILLIVNAPKKTDGKKTSDTGKKAVLSKNKNVTFVDCARSDEETVKKWIYVTCKRAGIMADGITCGKISSYCLGDMSRISKETEKLLLYCQAKGVSRLTDEIVDEVVYPDSEYKIYELSNAVSRKNYGEYVKIMNELSAKGFDETALLATLAAHFKGVYEVSIMKGSDAEIAAALGLREFAVKKNREQAKSFGRERLAYLYKSVFEAISGFKCGELTQNAALKLVTAKIFF